MIEGNRVVTPYDMGFGDVEVVDAHYMYSPPDDAPIIVGGSAGSGTRLVVWLIQACKIYMGCLSYMKYQNPGADATDLYGFFEKVMEPYLLTQYEEAQYKDTIPKLRACLDKHMAHMTKSHDGWGFKNPRSIDVLPYFHSVFSNMKFIHVIRDGRDVNVQHMIRYVKEIYWNWLKTKENEEILKENSIITNYMTIWSFWNELCADYGETYLGERYMRLKLEDIVNDWDIENGTLDKLIKFIGCSIDDVQYEMIPSIIIPQTIGQHNTVIDEENKLAAIQEGGEALLRFGYEL